MESTPGEPAPPVVAIVDRDPDVADMLRALFTEEGFVVVVPTWTEPPSDAEVAAFVHDRRPDVIVYDVSHPYEANWNRLCRVRALPDLPDVGWVLTTTNPVALRTLAGRAGALETILIKPYGADELVRAVRAEVRRRRGR